MPVETGFCCDSLLRLKYLFIIIIIIIIIILRPQDVNGR